MTTPYLGEVRMFAGNFPPRGNAFAQGQIMNIAQNQALFAVIGTYYGGNGVTTFALPDLRSRVAVGMGHGAGLSNYNIGQASGTETVTLNIGQVPVHNHSFVASNVAATLAQPSGNVPGTVDSTLTALYVPAAQVTGTPGPMNPTAVGFTGGNQPHENRMSVLAISYIVALTGIFPSRN